MTLPDILLPTYRQMLPALSAWLGKAAAQMPGEAAERLLTARLAPDMFPLATQVRFACVQAYEGVCRLQDRPVAPAVAMLLEEGRHAAERPGTIAAAQARITEAVTMVAAADAFVVEADTPVAHALPQGMVFDLTGAQYVRDWAIPQFYFHVMAAYTILRTQGVDLGKTDYVAHVLAHLRPGTMPG